MYGFPPDLRSQLIQTDNPKVTPEPFVDCSIGQRLNPFLSCTNRKYEMQAGSAQIRTQEDPRLQYTTSRLGDANFRRLARALHGPLQKCNLGSKPSTGVAV